MEFLFNLNEVKINISVGEVYTEYAGNPCIGRTEYKITKITSDGDVYAEEIFCNVRDLKEYDVY